MKKPVTRATTKAPTIVRPLASKQVASGSQSVKSVEMVIAKVCGKVIHLKSDDLLSNNKESKEVADNIYVSKDMFPGTDWDEQKSIIEKDGHGTIKVKVTIEVV